MQIASHVPWWQRACGLVLLAMGAIAEGIAGWMLLTGGSLIWWALHVTAILFSVQGLSLCLRGISFITLLPRFRRPLLSTAAGTGPSGQWATMAVWLTFFAGLAMFPGCGLVACGLASVVIRLTVRQSKPVESEEKFAIAENEMPCTVPNLMVEPLVHALSDADLETRRAAVAELGRLGNPSAIELLRQLLTDPSPEVRHDASVMLTRLENALIQPINATLARWEAGTSQPKTGKFGTGPAPDERAYLLAEQYYRYAESNVLDVPSRHPYLLKARELLTVVLEHDEAHIAARTLRARVHLRLNEPTIALQDVIQALKFHPANADLTLLAMESAYGARDWGALIALAHDALASATDDTATRQIARSWTARAPGGEIALG